jgi:hypothetical protein
LAFVGSLAHGAEVYKSTDANGVPTFSDRPNANSQTVYVATPRAGRPGNTIMPRPAAPQGNTTPAQAGTRAAATSGGDAPQQTAAERTAERAKNCGLARERVEKYSISHRLYRDKGDGEREYLTDGEMDEAKARAAADVATWCG